MVIAQIIIRFVLFQFIFFDGFAHLFGRRRLHGCFDYLVHFPASTLSVVVAMSIPDSIFTNMIVVVSSVAR